MILRGKTTLITGASAGIGKSCAEVFAEAGSNLILTARRLEIIEELAKELSEKFQVSVFVTKLDVRDRDAVENAIKNVPENFAKIDILINNAGLARGLSRLHEGDIQDWEEMIDTNVKGLLYVSRAVIPGMVARGDGFVINIGSLAGHEVYPNGNVYCGTKHAVKAISKGMTIDLNASGVRVTNIDPGLVETEFSEVRFHGDKDKAASVYKGYDPLRGIDIAEIALFAATRAKHVNIQELLVTPTAQATATIIDKRLDKA